MTSQDEFAMLPYGNPWEDGIVKSYLESTADGIVRRSSIMNRVAEGDFAAVEAYFKGFWPFVNPFSSNIYKFRPPIGRLRKNLGIVKADGFVRHGHRQMQHMAAEEGEHAVLWIDDAKAIGIMNLDGAVADHPVAPHVQELIDRSKSPDVVQRLLLLAATEGMAEALSRFLAPAPKFCELLGGTYRWGLAHLQEHEGASHYQIDLAMLQALLYAEVGKDKAIELIHAGVVEVLNIFGRGAEEVEAYFCPVAHAAE